MSFRENITKDIESVKVYGKIPRKSIRIPTFIGTYSPDFMYIVKRENGKEDLNLIVETKDVSNETDLRENEKIKIECAKIFFKNLKKMAIMFILKISSIKKEWVRF